ncbi:hypothetical protein GA0070607_0052 [Micromonospora coriariae]|uniref:Uncharacterized protein n=1 Tax=Micromonospora coriariae TaxID=285665 RepID=A0A1C4U2D3_9ACTN|nr:hypothetical protein GA0070607_0052 [Micromonospora coriariae]
MAECAASALGGVHYCRGVAEFRAHIGVHYGFLEIADDQSWGRTDWANVFFGRRPTGLIATSPGEVFLVTGRHTGTVGFTVRVNDGDPGPDLEGFEDVVEVPFEALRSELRLFQWAGEKSHTLPRLSAGPGSYRMRYHCRGMDEAGNSSRDYCEVVDEYLLQIWPSPAAPPATLKAISREGRRRIFES